MKQHYSLDNRYSLIRNEDAELCAKKIKLQAGDLQEHMRDIEQYSRENSIVHRLCTKCNTPVPRWYGLDCTHLLPFFINTPSCLVVIWNSPTPWISFANWTNKLTHYFALFIPVLLLNCSLMMSVHLDDHIGTWWLVLFW